MTRYRTIVADPPWPFTWSGGPGGLRRNATPLAYPLMSLDDIKALPVSDHAERDAHLHLWVTAEMNRKGEGEAVANAWGFSVVDEIVWEKPNMGTGRVPRHCHETFLLCRRGDLPFSGPRDIRSVQRWKQPHGGPRGGKQHSAKPDGFYDLVETVSPGPYLELFSRRARLGWDTWGNEALCHVDLGGEAA